MAQFTPPGKAARATVYISRSISGNKSARPRGIGLSALALLGLLVGSLVRDMLELHRATAPASTVSPGATSSLGPVAFELLRIGFYFGIGGLCIWQLWRGRSWARLLVLVWSLAAVARALSFLSEHNLDLAALMGRPLNFFQAVLASILLYWLNTPRVRAWYKKSSAGAGEWISERLRGRLCTGVEFHSDAGRWQLHFEHNAELILRCPWRIVLDDNLAFVTEHDGDALFIDQTRSATPPQQADQGLVGDPARAADQHPPKTVPAPGHSPQEARRLLQNLRVRTARIAPRSSDLFVSFEMGIELQTWSSEPKASSAPAPLWEYSDPALTVIANETGVKAELAAAPTETED